MSSNLPIFTHFLVCASAFFGTLIITPLVKRFAVGLNAIDKPETRKIHAGAIPRMGGLGIFFGVLTSVGILYLFRKEAFVLLVSKGYFNILIGSFLMLLLGMFDDKFGVNARIKFLVQVVIAIYVVHSGLLIEQVTNPFGSGPFHLGVLAYPITILWIVGVTNAINLSDGLDGLASGVSLIVAITMFAVSLITNHPATGLISAALTGALLGFLKYNFNPAEIFMGDTGSLFLGFVLATISIKGSLISSTTVSILVPLIALGVPIFDTLFSIVRRVVTRMSPFTADAQHVHHRLLAFGLNQRQTVIILYIISIVFGLVAFLLTAARNETAAGLLFVVAIIIYIGVQRLGYVETILLKMREQRDANKKRLYHDLYVSSDKPVSAWIRYITRNRVIEVLLDLFFMALSLALTRIIFEGYKALSSDWSVYRDQLLMIALCCYGPFFILGFYRELWKYIDIHAIGKYIKGVFSGTLLAYFALTWLNPSGALQPGHFLVLGLFLMVFVSTSRIIFNFYATYQKRELRKLSGGERVLIYGAGDSGVTILHTFIKEDNLDYRPIGFIDDDPSKLNRSISGYTVLGSLNDLENIILAYQVQRIVISTGYINGNHEAEVKDLCRKHRVRLCRFRIQLYNISVNE
ncbi:MAG: hypothetical protein A2268_16640 [Candidatus Raymondbacteria bacterium RifOxyA12_full_50_37]|uniref:Uncharacterized protein n=1 Tax=Candidatus Raymondbacteria bacterium RIFOXYD12_FULL_49_13 TaxID=1817890 RepID=A0A1F7F4G1_UNCRA|nr:MAG: hypothetical protein A2268_16640 [Candidatus Raymondbacteria bacterium RifOxyA12_full_50_37]OGJ86238.1 MAG: hypothetical protein A2248_16230 [Candidatus Raymondbacteria bacterium RIFOXYA2_FULL_49_16]OGJ95776.1 MAG: hypothetical protein A2453_11550 [Candidatus Raymondbacteria bacterium RIFOXYC2_FULL_50_21]OGK01463.1 MAG: hypothetical protein A2519_19255 [Candidatus Raymondbacteria bacterium RIFOXYD12_FULL_49_13]OGK03467.1 MAG: hypothetical protein A2350_16035 [Candidatus Raymondbacteria 